MSLKENLLELLQKNSGEFLSGEKAAEILSVSRTAVWKAVTALKKEGYNIESVTNRGYRLSADTDVLSACGINDCLGGQAKKYDISVLGTVTSTNALIKTEAAKNAPEGRIIIAAEQTAGRGRFGRSFFSPTGSGLYISILLRPTLPVTAAVSVTAAAAAAMTAAISSQRLRRCPARGRAMTRRCASVAVQRGQKDASCASGAPQWGHFLSVFVMSVTAPPAAPAPSDTAAPGWSWCSAAPPARRDRPPAAGRDAAR